MSFETQMEAFRLAAIAKAEQLMADPAELSAFLAARLDEDEARIHNDIAWWWSNLDRIEIYTGSGQISGGEQYIAPLIDPARVLAEVVVKQERLRMYVQQRETLRDVYANPDRYTFDQQLAAAVAASVHEVLVRMDATVHDRHPGFKPEWRLP